MGARSELTQLLAVYWSLLLGNIVEWYEFAIYGHLAIYMEKHFFQGSAVGVWLGFSLTFVCRPLGGVILGVVGDRFGRSVAVNISIIGMLIGTCGQGLLPTLDCGIPWLGNLGLVMLVILRCIQGLSAAGEIVTITSYLTEVASPSILSRGAALVNITGSCGFLLAKFVSFSVEAIFGAEAVDAWAWRLPFLLAIVPGMIAVVGRRGIPESGMFLESQANDSKMAAESSLAKVMRALHYWPNMLVCFGVVATFGVLQYGCLVWIHMFLAKNGMSTDDRMVVGLITRCLMICLGLPIGWLSDKIGVGWLMTITSAAVMVCGLPLWAVIASNPTDLMAVSLAFGVGFGLLASFSGTLLYHFIVELFPTEVRTTGMGLSYNLGFSLFGGLSPLTVTLLFEASWLGPGVLYTIAGGIGLLTMVVARWLKATGRLEIAYVRTHPYFGRCSTGPEDVELHEGHRRTVDKKVGGKMDEEIGFGGNPIKQDTSRA